MSRNRRKKNNVYKKRQMTALSLLAFIIILLFLMIKCTADAVKRTSEQKPAEISEGTYDVPDMDIPENSVILKNERPDAVEYTEADNLVFADAEFTPEDISLINENYLKDVVIIGDSISKGYSVYGRLSENNVLAEGSIGIRNVMETNFSYQGYELPVTDIISRITPKYIFVSFGMNDIHMRTEEQYTEDYRNFISELQKASPDSYIIVTAITPVSRQTDFTQNSIIDAYNEALRKMVYDYNSDTIYYANAARYLKDSDNYMISEFSSGDGIHLSASAYDYLLTYMLSMLEWI